MEMSGGVPLSLPTHVGKRRVWVLLGDAERAVSLLPSKSQFRPGTRSVVAGRALERTQQHRERHGAMKVDGGVDVIVERAKGVQRAKQPFCIGCDRLVDRRLERSFDPRRPQPGAPDQVDQDARAGVSHRPRSVRSSGLQAGTRPLRRPGRRGRHARNAQSPAARLLGVSAPGTSFAALRRFSSSALRSPLRARNGSIRRPAVVGACELRNDGRRRRRSDGAPARPATSGICSATP